MYSKLLLSAGGGIIAPAQQAEQDNRSATLLIGLGGTGIDCLAKIKQAVYERLKPDYPDASFPTYEHIQFLAVDSMFDRDPNSVFDCKKDEIFYIEPSGPEELVRPHEFHRHPELDWLNRNHFDAIEACYESYYYRPPFPGPCRNARRYQFMLRSNQFLERISQLICRAKTNLDGQHLTIHVFSGLSGGTGGGIFLDACYLIRQAIERVNGGNGDIFGYFFLPDVNLEKIPFHVNRSRESIRKNGYAAMQELDYCMRLEQNGGAFTQKYKNGLTVNWTDPPVDRCHLVSADNMGPSEIGNAYDHALCVVSEYVMDFLTKDELDQTGPYGETQFSLQSHLAHLKAHFLIADQEKQHGYHLKYFVIGAACASIPMRKINTYLAAKVFESFSQVKGRVPTEMEVEKLAAEAGIASIDRLLIEIQKGASTEFEPLPAYIDWQYTRDNGNKQLLYHYTNQKDAKVGVLQKNAQSMVSEGNTESLISRICAQLNACARDLQRGPAYAYGVLQASKQGNLLNIVNGLLADITGRIKQRDFEIFVQPENMKAIVDQALAIWSSEKDNGLLGHGKAKKAFENYVYALENYERSLVEIESMKQLKWVLQTLRKQLAGDTANYYLKFNRVFETLLQTFKENLGALNAELAAGQETTSSFEKPLVTIAEIQNTLDESVAQKDPQGLLGQFIDYLLAGEDIWLEEKEEDIANAVRSFFLSKVFTDWANHSITQFLKEKYHKDNNAEVTQKVYEEYMRDLQQRSKALFPVNGAVWSAGAGNEVAYISVPGTDQEVLDAASMLANASAFQVKRSASTDRICAIRCMVGVPLFAYAHCEWYEQEYYNSWTEENLHTRHIYMGKGGSPLFNDWNKLPPLTPQSLLAEPIPYAQKKLVREGQEVYEEAVRSGLLVGNQIKKISEQSEQSLAAAIENASCAQKQVNDNPSERAGILRSAKDNLEQALQSVTFEDTSYSLPTGSALTPVMIENVRKDYFVSSPALYTVVRQSLAKIRAAEAMIDELDGQNQSAVAADKDLKNFGKALFLGVIAWKRMKVTYTKVEYVLPTIVVLSDSLDGQFAYSRIPVYQAYLSYKNLDADTRDAIDQETLRRSAFADDSRIDQDIASVKGYAAKFTDDYNQNLLAAAEQFPEIQDDVRKLIIGLNEELKSLLSVLSSLP